MAEIFVAQNALRLEVDTNLESSELSTALLLRIYYKKPSGSTSYFSALEDTDNEGIIYHDVVNDTDLDESGKWYFWSYVQFSDGRVGYGIPRMVRVNTVGDLI